MRCKSIFVRALITVLAVATLMVCCPVAAVHAETTTPADDGKVIITLDPGHGKGKSADGSTGAGTDGAVQYGGLNELYYTLFISQFAKERLEQYANVEVYLTREDNEWCPGLKERADFAASHNSDALISVHLNGSTGRADNGAEVIIPNANYRPDICEQSAACAEDILSTIVAQTGVTRRTTGDDGIYDRTTTEAEDGYKYADGSMSDYFKVIRNGKENGTPVVMIVETAYASNPMDYINHFKTEEGQKRMGYALADGLAKYYNLTLLSDVTEAETEVATDASTEAVTDVPTEAETQAVTEAPTETPTHAATEMATQAMTQAATEAPTESMTQTDTDAPAEQGGCTSALTGATGLLAASVAGAVVLKKRKKD